MVANVNPAGANACGGPPGRSKQRARRPPEKGGEGENKAPSGVFFTRILRTAVLLRILYGPARLAGPGGGAAARYVYIALYNRQITGLLFF